MTVILTEANIALLLDLANRICLYQQLSPSPTILHQLAILSILARQHFLQLKRRRLQAYCSMFLSMSTFILSLCD
jgi:hypothetical protein